MSFIIKFVKGVRNHWKKSTFAAIAITYGSGYTKEYFEIQDLMREYCKKAALYGNTPLPINFNPKTITVILNPNANRRKATEQFEKYCAPILYLSGVCVDVIQTESEGHAKSIAENLDPTDAIIVAGGDGTISEVITGLLRKNANAQPIGILPLGRSNSVGKNFFPGGDKVQNVKSLADASLAIVEKCTRPIDVMKIEVLNEEVNEEDTAPTKPVYAVSSLQWGAYRDAKSRQDKYWYFGSWRKYATYLFNGYKNSLSWNCEAEISYKLPCSGCSNCMEAPKSNVKWYQKFYTTNKQTPEINYSQILNAECDKTHNKTISTLDLALQTSNVSKEPQHSPSKLSLKLGPDKVDYIDFVSQGWQSEHGINRDITEVIEAREIEIKPKIPKQDKDEKWFYIDNENFEVKPIRITLLPKKLQMFCKQNFKEVT